MEKLCVMLHFHLSYMAFHSHGIIDDVFAFIYKSKYPNTHTLVYLRK